MIILTGICLLLGSLFLLLAAAGAMKFPDLLMRMAAVSKASTLGAIFYALAAGFYFSDLTSWIKVLILIVFFLLSTPVAAHLLGRAALRNGIDIFSRTKGNRDGI